jgi:protein gp37
MAETSGISWTDATFNPWRGCTKVSPECDRCYAETMSGRNPSVLGIWGNEGTRVVAAESYWRTPLKWNAKAEREGKRLRVFCASLADVFEEWPGQMTDTNGKPLWIKNGKDFVDADEDRGAGAFSALNMNDCRRRLFALIDSTPSLDWMLLTKRPENIQRMWPAYFPGGYIAEAGRMNQEGPRPNVWLGTTAGLQETADKNIPKLLECEGMSPVLWVSCEPMLGPVNFHRWLCKHANDNHPEHRWCNSICSPRGLLKWIITGGESGHGARPCNPDWVRSVRDQCQAAGVAFHHKQWGEWVALSQAEQDESLHTGTIDWTHNLGDDDDLSRVGKKNAGRLVDGILHDAFPIGATQ